MNEYEFRGYKIPSYMMPGLVNYIRYATEPGGFLVSVLSNDLQMAVGRADSSNLKNLVAYVGFLYNEAPTGCWGSPEKYKNWKGMPEWTPPKGLM